MVIKINQNGLSENRTSGYINSHEFADVTETMSGAPGYFINNRTLFLSLLFCPFEKNCVQKFGGISIHYIYWKKFHMNIRRTKVIL